LADSILLKISKVRGGLQLQAPGGAVGIAAEDPAELGKMVLEMLEAPQPEVVVEPNAEPQEGPGLEDFPAAEGPFSDGDPFVELQQKGIDWLNQNGNRLIEDGLGFLRDISRKKPAKDSEDAKP
jgi:hypothetical protein